ncbi:MAG: PVC-type heme-binding CxxCH protein [Planctomycetaceae bacterium]
MLIRAALTLGLIGFAGMSPAADQPLKLQLRSRTELGEGTGRYQPVVKPTEWDAKQTAIVVCDMWDTHTCPNAALRVSQMAPRMNDVLKSARARGVLIIHCPSDTMTFYQDHPGRKLAMAAPTVETKRPLERWCSLDKDKEGPLPIDDSDGGCDCEMTWKRGDPYPWTRQIATLEIQDGDAITDSAEAYYLMRQRGIENVIVMGVHTNMCVLGRPFSIRQLSYQGLNVALMRDLTDTMYNPEKSPCVSHFTGTDLVVEHIEKNWCPTLISGDLLDGKEFRFPDDRRPHVVIVSAEDEYKTEETLPVFAAKHLGRDFRVTMLYESPGHKYDVPGLEALDDADVLLLSARRRPLPKAQLDRVRNYLAAGKPLVGIRTANHAFCLRNSPPPDGLADWPEFDKDAIGGSYTGHHGNELKAIVWPIAERLSHPILKGIEPGEFAAGGSLYKVAPVAKNAEILLNGKLEQQPGEVQPVAWTFPRADGGKTFYTSLGHVDDFASPRFQRLLLNALLWATDPSGGRESPDATSKVPIERIQDTDAPRSGWAKISVPGLWEDQIGPYDGFAWYRCVVKVPAEWKGRTFYLYVELVDNACETFFNGVRVGVSGALPPQYVSGLKNRHRYVISGDLIKPGEINTIAVRVYDHEGKAGFKGMAPLLIGGNESLDTAGTWEFRKGDAVAWSKEAITNLPPFEKIVPTPALSPFATVINRVTQEDALPPAQALEALHTQDDLDLELVLSEPEVRQPLFMNFDERGRMWVMQYIQYPEPAGLTLLSKDQWWRAVYDKIPEPPPQGVKGMDKITIHEDTDGDGKYDTHKTFLDGLNIATSFVQGRDGVFVLNPPYLLFYADRNHDDVPDGDPEVLLSGFGLEDTHSVVNSLRWGPDGWLYAAQGSTVSAAVKRPGDKHGVHSQGQNIWRYHPETKRYEVFCEGGGNAFGCEIDSAGRIFSGHNGGDTRGFHYVQGGYLQKGFSKHGALSNPYAFGYFPAMAHPKVPRFTHTFIIYEGNQLPERYHGKLFGVAPLLNHVVISEIQPAGSTFATRDIGYAMESTDKWFKPVDVKDGPDGWIYVADWYDPQLAHTSNYQGGMDRDRGRIYRIRSKKSSGGREPPESASNVSSDRNQGTDVPRSASEVLKQLQHPDRWHRETARRLIADSPRNAELGKLLEEKLFATTGPLAIEFLWSVHLNLSLTETMAVRCLDHSEPQVRLWAVRLLADDGRLPSAIGQKAAALAKAESNIEVRSQLAASAKRLPAEQALPIIQGLLTHDEDATDPRLPLQIWWALEHTISTAQPDALALFDNANVWRLKLVEEQILPRLMQRFATTGQRADLMICAKLLKQSPGPNQTKALMDGFEKAFAGRSLGNVPTELVRALSQAGGGSLSLKVRQGDESAVREALAAIAAEKTPSDRRSQLITLFGEVKRPECVPVLLEVLTKSSDEAARAAALGALASYTDQRIPATVLGQYQQMTDDLRSLAQGLLVSRKPWAGEFLEAVERGDIAATSVPDETVRKLSIYRDERIAALIKQHWGTVAGQSTEEMQAQLERYTALLSDGLAGDPYPGKQLYMQMCGKCHRLHDQGGQIGPDLTSFKRDDVSRMLLNVINPSAEIREGFETLVATTVDGRVVTGFLVEQDPQVVVIRTAEGQTVSLDRSEVDELIPQKKSLMPEGQLKTLTDEQVRNLFAYLRSGQPLAN